MFSTATFTSFDPIRHGPTVRAASMELLRVERGDFRSQTTRVDLDRLWLQCGEVNLAYLGRVTAIGDRVFLVFLRPTSAPMTWLGADFIPGHIAPIHAERPVSLRSTGPSHFASMSLTPEDFASHGHALVGRETTPPRDDSLLTPTACSMAKLTTLHEATVHLARSNPVAMNQSGVSHGMAQQLIQAMFGCLATAEDRQPDRLRRHARVLARFEAVVEANPDVPLYMPEVCAAVGVPARTLHHCCAEHLGMSPKRYLDLRRMHLARRALVLQPPADATVTTIITRYGFWELGRFAAAYRSLYGETPSQTLSRAA